MNFDRQIGFDPNLQYPSGSDQKPPQSGSKSGSCSSLLSGQV